MLPFASLAQFSFSNTYTGAQEVPANSSTGTGTITGTYDSTTNILSYTITFSGLSANTTAAHFHGSAFPGTNAAVAIAHRNFPTGVTSGSLPSTNDTLTQAQEAALLAGKWYSNIHTTALPGGEIRAQIFFTGGTFAAPTITCPADTTVSNAAGVCTQSLTFAAQSTGTPAAEIQYKIGPTVITSPHTFPGGTSTVTAIALNGAGMANCSFKVTVNDTTAPVIACPANVTAFNDPGVCGAAVQFNITATDNCPGVLVTSVPASGSFFAVGTTTVTASATDAAGNISTCTFTVTVIDNEPPVITGLKATPDQLWPPNHKMMDVMVDYASTDNCVVVSCELSVTSNEAQNGNGDGNTEEDWIVVDNHHLKLRAERSGNASGRIYTITVTCTDQYGNSSSKTTTVKVPHNKGSVANFGRTSNLFVRVSPNPGIGSFSMNIQSLNQYARIDMKITDQSGRVVETRNNLAGNQTISFGDKLKPGIYFIALQQGNETQTMRLVKTN